MRLKSDVGMGRALLVFIHTHSTSASLGDTWVST